MFRKNWECKVYPGKPLTEQSIGSIPYVDAAGAFLEACSDLLASFLSWAVRGSRRIFLDSRSGFPILVLLVLASSPLLSAQEAGEKDSQIIYPNSTASEESDESQSEVYKDLMPEGGSEIGMAVTILGYLIILGGLGVVVWFLFKRGVIRKPFSSSEGKLKVAESRMLGNRQYIMVVEYEEKKILLGVGPGKIDYLTSLDGYRNEFPKIEPELERVSVQEMA